MERALSNRPGPHMFNVVTIFCDYIYRCPHSSTLLKHVFAEVV